MPHRQIPCTRKASLVRNTLPTLYKLLTWSSTTTRGILCESLNSSTLFLPISVTFSFLIIQYFSTKLTKYVDNFFKKLCKYPQLLTKRCTKLHSNKLLTKPIRVIIKLSTHFYWVIKPIYEIIFLYLQLINNCWKPTGKKQFYYI